MKCRDFELLLKDYENTDLLPSQAKDHLSSCDACSRLQGELEMVWNRMDDWHAIEPSADFQDRFWLKAKAGYPAHPLLERIRGVYGFSPWSPVLAGAFLVLLLIGGGVLFQANRIFDTSVKVLNIQDQDNIILESFNQPETVEASEELEAFDAWILEANEEVPGVAPTEETYPSKDSPERRTFLKEKINLA